VNPAFAIQNSNEKASQRRVCKLFEKCNVFRNNADVLMQTATNSVFFEDRK